MFCNLERGILFLYAVSDQISSTGLREPNSYFASSNWRQKNIGKTSRRRPIYFILVVRSTVKIPANSLHSGKFGQSLGLCLSFLLKQTMWAEENNQSELLAILAHSGTCQSRTLFGDRTASPRKLFMLSQGFQYRFSLTPIRLGSLKTAQTSA